MRDQRSTVLTAGGTKIVQILNVAVTDAAWTAIILGATDNCRSVELGLRSGGSFKLSHVSNGATYKTISPNIALDIIKSGSDNLCYIQTSSGADTLECILLD